MRGNPGEFLNETPDNVTAVFTRAQVTMGDWDWRGEANRVTAPAMFVFGSADILPWEAAQEWAECLPNCSLFKMEGVGHFPSLEAPEIFFPELERFLES
jgi:pimeloyl-ACP methyl ester carboxylesterase